MAFQLYLGRWKWHTDQIGDDGAGNPIYESYWAAPLKDGVLSTIDLRALPHMAQAGGVAQGYGLFAYPTTVTDPDLIQQIGGSLDDALTLTQRRALKQRFGLLGDIEAVGLREIIFEILARHADPTGQNRWKPLVPGRGNVMRVVGARQVFHEMRVRPGIDREWDGALAVLREDYKKLAAENETLCRKWLDWAQEKHGVDYTQLWHPDAPQLTPLPHGTAVSDDFLRANTTTTAAGGVGLGANWTDDGSSGWYISSNGARIEGLSDSIRYNTALSGTDQFAQSIIDAWQRSSIHAEASGPTARHSSSAETHYLARLRGDSSDKVQLYKAVAASYTQLDTDYGITVSLPETIRLDVDGSSIVASRGGSAVISVTDTAISSGNYCGMRGTSDANGAYFTRASEWSAEDLAAGGGTTISVPAGSLTLSANAPTVVVSDNKTVAVPAASLTLTANAPADVNPGVKFRVDTDLTLLDGLSGYWKLEESSGTRVDSYGPADLSPGYTTTAPGSATGKQGSGVDLENSADVNYLTRTPATSLAMGDFNFTWAGWIKAESFPSSDRIIRMWENEATVEVMQLYIATGTSLLTFNLHSSSGDSTVTASTFGAISTATWYFVEVYHDATNNLIGIRVNNGTANTTAHSTGVRTGTGAFYIGAYSTAGAGIDGICDEWGYWRKLLSAQERSDLYNGGSGNTILLDRPVSVSIPTGSLTLTGQTPTTLTPRTVAVPAGSLTFSTKEPTVTITSDRLVAVPAGTLTLSAQTPTVVASNHQWLDIPAASLTLSAQTPVVVNPHAVFPNTATLALSTKAPNVVLTAVIDVPAGTLSLTTPAPTLDITATLSIDAGTLTLTANIPTIQYPRTILPPAASLALAAATPTIYTGLVCPTWTAVADQSTTWDTTSPTSTTWTDTANTDTTWTDFPTCGG